MTMKKPIEEVMEQATKGILWADGCDVVKAFNGARIARAAGSKTEPAQDRANAALLVHCFNTAPQLLAALKNLVNDVAVLFPEESNRLCLYARATIETASGVEWDNNRQMTTTTDEPEAKQHEAR